MANFDIDVVDGPHLGVLCGRYLQEPKLVRRKVVPTTNECH